MRQPSARYPFLDKFGFAVTVDHGGLASECYAEQAGLSQSQWVEGPEEMGAVCPPELLGASPRTSCLVAGRLLRPSIGGPLAEGLMKVLGR